MRSQPTARKPSTSNRGRAALVANSVDLVDEWRAHRRKTGHSINATMAALLDQVDFDRVRPSDLTEAMRVLLARLPTDVLVNVSTAANIEREILVECMGDRAIGVADDQLLADMPLADLYLVCLLDELRSNPDVLRAAVYLLNAVGKENIAGPGANPLLRGGDKTSASSGRMLRVVHKHDRGTVGSDTGCASAATEHEVRGSAKPPAGLATRKLGGR